jgi:hypothetical protein
MQGRLLQGVLSFPCRYDFLLFALVFSQERILPVRAIGHEPIFELQKPWLFPGE